MTSCGLINCS